MTANELESISVTVPPFVPINEVDSLGFSMPELFPIDETESIGINIPPITDNETESIRVTDAFQIGIEGQSQILLDGTNNMTTALREGTAYMAVTVADAVRAGLSGVTLQNNIVVQDQGFVTH